MLNSDEIKEIILNLGAKACGIASIERFAGAPPGFHPTDIYPDCKSVIVFIKSLPTTILSARTMIPYTHFSNIIFAELDQIGLKLSRILETQMMHGVPVPCDTPYEYWDAKRMHGMGILSMRHAGYLAGLGILGKNTLLINEQYGNRIYIGAVLTNCVINPDPLVTDISCPPNCRVCIESCPVKAIEGTTVDQLKCRKASMTKIGRDFDLTSCNLCRRNCVMGEGKNKPL